MSKPLDDAWTWFRTHATDKGAIAIAAAAFMLIGTGWDARAVRRQVEVVEKKQDRYEANVDEFRRDIVELYRVTPWVRTSPRFEAALQERDGGAP